MRKQKKLVFCVLFLAMVMLISGCMKMHYDVIWKEDNSGTLVITIGMENSAMADSGQTEDEVRSQMKEDYEDNNDAKIADYSDDEYTGITVTMEIADLTTTDNEALKTLDFNYSEEGKTKTYSVSGNFSGESTDDMGMMGSADVKLSIVMPGNITSHNATEQEGNKLFWDMTAGNTKIEASSEIIGSGGGIINILIWVLFAVSILILAAAILLIIVKLQRK